jgi:hypothetical protein
MSSRTLIALSFALLNVKCLSEGLVVQSRNPPVVAADTSPSVYLSENEEPRYYIPELVCHGLRKPVQYDGQWVLGIDSKKLTNGFIPWLFFDNEMNARSCSVYFPGLQIRRRKAGCCWVKG